MNKIIINVVLLNITLNCIFMNACFAEQKIPRMKALTLKEAILLSLRYNPNVISSEVQRVVDKFSLAVAKNQFELQYALTGTGSQTKSRVGGAPYTTSGSYNIIPVLTKQSIYGTKYNLAFSNPVTLSDTPETPTTTFYNPALTLTVTQPLIQGSGREVVEAPLFAALNNEEIAKLNYKNTIIADITQIMLDYWNVVGAENALIVAQNALKVSIQTVNQNKVQIKLGFLAPSENVQAEAAVASQRIQVSISQNQLYQAKLTLLNDIGLSPQTVFKIDTKVNLDKFKYPKGKEAERMLLANNPSYQILMFNLRNAKIGVLLAEDQQRWTLDFVGTIVQGGGSGGGFNGNFNSLFNGANKSRNLGLALNIPIDNLPNQQKLVSAKVSYTQQQLAAQLLRLSLVTQLLNNQENLRILRLQVDLAIQSIQLAYQSYQDALKKALYGQASYFEVTTLQTNYVNASFTLINTQISFLTAIAQYYQTLGITLDIWDINLVY